MRTRFLGGAAAVAMLTAGLSSPAHAIITPDTTTPAAVIDSGNTQPFVAGLVIRNEAGTGGSTCSGMLINPRTVIFAAHCVDGRAPAAYDAPTGAGNAAQVGYTLNPTFGIPNAITWLSNIGNTSMNNSVMVWYDPRSRNGPARPAGDGTFLPADVAIAAFAAPNEALGRDAINGTMLLFSPVTTQPNITHAGFGQSGTEPGTVRASDFQRRTGTNNLGFLGNQRDINLGFYGTTIADLLSPGTLTFQDLYWTDFDDPSRATRPFFNGPGFTALNASTLDADIFPGNATANEVNTGGGDSGSPLLTTAFGRQASLGVLSQGSRFFFESLGNPNDNSVRTCQSLTVPAPPNNANFSCLGSASGYNPLFLFWDQIVVNNPYKYVQAAAGDGEWTNPARWTQELDPLYAVLSGTTLVNGLPTTPALGVSSAAANVGTVRANPSPPAACAFTGTCPPTGGTGDPIEGESPLPGSVALPDAIALPDTVTLSQELTIAGNPSSTTNPGEVALSGEEGPVGPTEQANTTALWSSGTLIPVNTGTLTGPGTTNFVPDNTNGTAGLQNSARFFEVNLRNAGTTFITGTTVTIDRLNLRGATAGLNIRAGAGLNTTISSFVDNGTLTVNGNFSASALTAFGGKIMGTGTITTLNPLTGFTNTAGRVAPGNSIGTMTHAGNFTQGAGGTFEVEVTNGAADLLNVTGTASLAGTIDVKTFGAAPLKGQSFVVLNAAGGRTGTFTTVVDNIAGVLRPSVTFTANTVVVTIIAPTFCEAAPGAPLCAYLDGLDGATTPAMQAQIQALQNLDPSQIAGALASINPSRVNGQTTLGFQLADLIKLQLGHRSSELLWQSNGGGASATLRAASQVASAGASADVIASAALAAMQSSSSGVADRAGWSLFAAGDIGSADTTNTSGLDEGDAQAFTAGADYSTGDGVIAGFAVSALDGEVKQDYGLGGKTDANGYAGSVYVGVANSYVSVDGYLSYSMSDYETNRTVMPAPLTFVNARGETNGSMMQAGATVNIPLSNSSKLHGATLSAVGGGYYSKLNIDGYTETGAGGWSAIIPDREVESFKAQAGLEVARPFAFSGGVLTPFVRVQASSELVDDGIAFTGSFVAAPASPFTVAMPELGGYWGTVALGATAQLGANSTIYVRYQNEFNREGQEADQVSLAARFGF